MAPAMLLEIPKALGYRATRDDHGTLTVHDVPIFCQCKRGDTDFDGEWIATAVKKALHSADEGYLPPLHIHHHEGDSTDVRAAGFFRITGTKLITFKSRPTIAVLADLIITDPLAQEEVLAKRLPYRSVEIFDVDEPSLDGLALLDHEAPFLELPMLMISEVDGRVDTHGVPPFLMSAGVADATIQLERRVNDGPMVACYFNNRRAALLFKESTDMAVATKTVEELAAEQAAEKAAASFAADDDDDKPDDSSDKPKDMEADGMDVSAIVKAIKSGTIPMKDFAEIMEAIRESQAEPEAAADPAANTPAPAAAPGGEAMKAGTDPRDIKMAKMQARLDVIEETTATDKAAAQRDKDVRDALKRVHGKPMGADPEARLVKYHTDHGAAAFAAYVDEVVRFADGTPSADADDRNANAFSGQTGAVPDVAMKYQDGGGSDTVDRAAKLCAEWNDLKSRNMTTLTRERYVETFLGEPATAKS